jgi:hypothetical protein
MKRVLVLGAGASCTYGYPVGTQLRRKILEATEDSMGAEGTFPIGLVREFREAFAQSQSMSIDRFLSRRSDFADIGRYAIAQVLLQDEDASEPKLMGEPDGEHWYRYLLDRLTSDDWDAFDPSWLTVVTFNYDRSLEWYLMHSLKAMYGKREDEVAEKLTRLKILHVYGSLGMPWGNVDPLPYTLARRQRMQRSTVIRQAAERLRVIPEGRDDDPSLQPIQAAIKEAEQIAFLGFSFDATNVRRLGAPQVFVRGTGLTPLRATTLGMTSAEVEQAQNRLLAGAQSEQGVIRRTEFQFSPAEMRCERFLRETLFLG